MSNVPPFFTLHSLIYLDLNPSRINLTSQLMKENGKNILTKTNLITNKQTNPEDKSFPSVS